MSGEGLLVTDQLTKRFGGLKATRIRGAGADDSDRNKPALPGAVKHCDGVR